MDSPIESPLTRISSGKRNWSIWRRNWPSFAVSLLLILAVPAQYLLPGGPSPALYGASFAALSQGHVYVLLTYMMLGGPSFLLQLGVLGLFYAVAMPVSDRLGINPRGAGLLALLLILCGVISALVAVIIPLGSGGIVRGSAASILGLLGAGTRVRLIDSGFEGLWAADLLKRMTPAIKRDLGIAGGAVLLNFLLGDGINSATWRAYAAALIAGYLLVKPLISLAKAPQRRSTSVALD